MMARRLLWLTAEASFSLLWIRFGSAAALALGLALVLIPLVSLPLNMYLRKKIRLTLTAPENLRKHQEGELNLVLENPTFLPVELSCVLRAQNLLNGSICRERISLTGRCLSVRLKSEYCGRLQMTLEKVRLWDCLGLIGLAVNCPDKCHTTVHPDGFEIQLTLADDHGGIAESEQYSPYRSGHDLTETFQLREYVPGDSPRQIHWKLSGKLDRLIVREPGLPIVQDVLVFWERTGGETSQAAVDAQAEAMVSIGRALLDQEVQFRLGWNDAAENRCVLWDIRDLEDLIAVLPRLMSASGGAECDYGASLLTQTCPDALCSHMVYVAHVPDPEVLLWESFGHVTVLAAIDGWQGAIVFDETNYPAQLGVLAI